MNKCFAYEEIIKNGKKRAGCEILNIDAFEQIHKKFGGCCMRNCPFYKEERTQIRSNKGLFYMTDKQKREQKYYYEKYYKNKQNVFKYE